MNWKALKHRKVKNLLIQSGMQYRMMIYFGAIVMITTATFVLFLQHQMQQIREIFYQLTLDTGGKSTSVMDHATYLALDNVIAGVPQAAYWLMILSTLISVSVIFYISHRYAGPTKVILDVLERLKVGDYDIKRSLRETDELVPILESIKDLANKLKK